MAGQSKKKQNLTVPYSRTDNATSNIKYNIETYDLKLVSDYSGLSFREIIHLDCFEFWQLLRDAVIYQAEKTPEGQDWLKQCWVKEQTEPDRETLRKLFG